MKKLTILLIEFYQAFLSPLLKTMLGTNKFCVASPSCSEYTRRKILEKGVVRGSLLGIKRLSACHQ